MEGISDEYMEIYKEMKKIQEHGFPAPKEILKDGLNLFIRAERPWEIPWLLENVELKEDMKILDMGCGTSVFPLYLLSKGYDVTAIDPKFKGGGLKKYLDYLEKQVYPHLNVGDRRVTYQAGDVTNVPLKGDSFDVVFAINVFDEIPFETAGIIGRKASVVLKKNGNLGVTMGNIHPYYKANKVSEFFMKIQKSSGLKVRGYKVPVGLEKYLKENKDNKTDLWKKNVFGFVLEKISKTSQKKKN